MKVFEDPYKKRQRLAQEKLKQRATKASAAETKQTK